MKTNLLIQLLQEADPSGELEVCVGNADIFYVDTLPAYYDGCLQVLIRDPAKKPYYDVVGGKYVGKGLKVDIRTLSISDAIFDDPNVKIEYEGVSESSQKRYEERTDERRKQCIKVYEDVEMSSFVEYVKKRFVKYDEEYTEEDAVLLATEFFKENLSHFDKMPEDIMMTKVKQTIGDRVYDTIPSWNERRFQQWDRELSLDIDSGKLVIRKK